MAPELTVTTKVRSFRAAKEWSQAELAERLGVSRQTINAIETGRYEPSLGLAFALAELFGCRMEELFTLERAGA